jgi:hypothetical protein
MPFRWQGMQSSGTILAVAAGEGTDDQVLKEIMDEAGRGGIKRLRRLEWDQGTLLFLTTVDVILETL